MSNNIIKAKEGFYFKNKYNSDITSIEYTGKRDILVGNEIKTINVKKEDFTEVFPVRIDANIYYIESTNYPEAVTELIRLKYSLDDELALMANARLGINEDYEKEFLAWRVKCKEAAKKIFK